MLPESQFRYDPDNAALVVIDVQNDFCSPEGSSARRGHDVSRAVEAVPRIRALIEEARAAGMRVVFVRTVHDETNDSPAWIGRRSDDPSQGLPGRTCVTGTWGAEFYGLAPEPDDIVVVKHRYSAFVGTNLELLLRSMGLSSVLFTGVATDVCVESSIRDGLFREFHVTLVEDCAAAFRDASHAASVKVVRENFGTVVRSEQLIGMWRSAAAAA